ncbi:MAG: hypothetical protein GY755_13550 [Chloroflexi bacterium]|nr:hypothetical protein [Chloroflexota bacterium]
MKKLFLFLAIAILPIITFGQSKIVMDKVDQSGYRFIGTSEEVLRNGFLDKYPMCFSLMYSTDGEIENYDLHVAIHTTVSISMPKGALLLIKTGSDEVIELKQTMDEAKTKDVVGTYNSLAGVRVYRTYASYGITREQLHKILDGGIAKLRLETSIENIDKVYKKSKIEQSKELFAGLCDLISGKLVKSVDIREGF